MNRLCEYLKNNTVVADGAAGTYLSSLFGRSASPCEALNINHPEAVLRMHRQYAAAGAKLILANTFGASLAGGSIGGDFSKTRKILAAGAKLALKAASPDAFAAADIGPLPETSADADVLLKEYHSIIDEFIKSGIVNFVFETFASAHYPLMAAGYIKKRLPDAFVAISFAVMPDGYSREGIAGQRLIDDVAAAKIADAAGFNCCSGPTHLLRYASGVDYKGLFPVIMPNAGYPQREESDAQPEDAGITYSGSPEYFAQKLASAPNAGFKIIGGCCGTTPRHIALLASSLKTPDVRIPAAPAVKAEAPAKKAQVNRFLNALQNKNRKTVIVELEPPFAADISKIEDAAKLLCKTGVDAVTVADSPMARARADAISTAVHLKKAAGIEVIPHLCCRDRNINAIKSALISAHIEGIRNVLAITGDPVPDTDRGTVKSVFNLNSEGLCRFVKTLNEDIFLGDEMLCGCAFNVNARNIDVEISRLKKKIAAGASFVMTQPVFTREAADAICEIRKNGAKVLAGILTPVSYKNAVFLANEMPGFKIPKEYLERFSPDMTRGEGEDTGIKISLEIASEFAGCADGFYFIVPFNRAGVTARLIEELRARNII